MGLENLKLGLEFSVFAAVFAAVFIWGLATGRTVMKAPLAASRSDEPVKFWVGQTLYGSWCLLCLYVAISEMPSRVGVRILVAH
jgi:hypothetical protein